MAKKNKQKTSPFMTVVKVVVIVMLVLMVVMPLAAMVTNLPFFNH